MSAGPVLGVREKHVARILAWLMRNEGVDAEAIERAVLSALAMRPGEMVTLTGGAGELLRRAFVDGQVALLTNAAGDPPPV